MSLLKPAYCNKLNTFLIGHKPEFLFESSIAVNWWSLESVHESLTRPKALRYSPPGLATLILSVSQDSKFLEFLQRTNLKADAYVLFACVDGLKGFPEAIQTAFPQTLVQFVHQIRYALRLIPDKNVKEFMVDLKAVYQAPTLKTAEDSLLILEEK